MSAPANAATAGALAAGPTPAPAPAPSADPPPIMGNYISDRADEVHQHVGSLSQNGRPDDVQNQFWKRTLNRADTKLRVELGHAGYVAQPTAMKNAIKIRRAYRILAEELMAASPTHNDPRLRVLWRTRNNATIQFFVFMETLGFRFNSLQWTYIRV